MRDTHPSTRTAVWVIAFALASSVANLIPEWMFTPPGMIATMALIGVVGSVGELSVATRPTFVTHVADRRVATVVLIINLVISLLLGIFSVWARTVFAVALTGWIIRLVIQTIPMLNRLDAYLRTKGCSRIFSLLFGPPTTFDPKYRSAVWWGIIAWSGLYLATLAKLNYNMPSIVSTTPISPILLGITIGIVHGWVWTPFAHRYLP